MKLRVVFFLFFTLSINVVVLAQSGRGRTPAPPPKPTPKQQPPPTPKILNLPEGGKIVKYDSDGTTSRFVLKNGLTVLIRERHSTPLAAVTTYVKTGYFDETDEITGLAHLMEHMLFKGTPTRPPGTIDDETARLGGVLNASTSYEKTSYYAIAPAESLLKILEIQADMLLNPAFDEDELQKEAIVVIQESKRKKDTATALALEKMYATAFTTHRMKRWRIGSDDVLKAATREQLQSFYQDYYRPENVVIVVVGDVLVNNVIPQIQQLYARFSAKPKAPAETAAKAPVTKAPGTPPKAESAKEVAAIPQPATIQAEPKPDQPATEQPKSDQPAQEQPPVVTTPPPSSLEEAAQDKLRYANLRGDIGQTIVTIGYRVPALSNTADSLKEQATIDVLSAVLGLGRGARLNSALREKKGFISNVNVQHLPLPTVGVFSVQMRVTVGQLDNTLGEYFREVERFRREILSEGELQRAKSMLEKSFYDSVKTTHNEAEALAHYQAQYGDFRLLDSYVERIRAVTAKDVQQAAEKYFGLSNTTVHEYEPHKAPARTFTPEKFAEAVAIMAPPSIQAIKPEEIKPAVALKQFEQGKERKLSIEGAKVIFTPQPLPVKDFSVYRGPRAYVREDKTQPKLTVGIFFQGGRLIEDAKTSGMTELMLRSMLKSTMTRKGDLIALELENYGGEINIVNEPDFFGFTLDVLSRNAEKAIAVLVEIVENPYFDKAEIARERELLLARQVQQRDDGLQRPIELAMAAVYPDHPYGLPRYGLPGVVKAANEETLEAWYKKSIPRQLPMVMLVGDTDGSSLVSSIFSDAFKRNSGDLDQTMKVNLPALTVSPQDQIEQRSRQQTAQAIAFRTPPPAQINNYALMVLQNYASGMGGRLFTELRDKQSLTYTVFLRHQQGLANGTLLAYIATSPENEVKARDGLLVELDNLVKVQPNDEEFMRGQNAAIGSYAISLQSHQTRLLEYARAVVFGRKASDVESQPELIRAVKKSDLKTAVEAIIKVTQAGRGVLRGELPASSNKN